MSDITETADTAESENENQNAPEAVTNPAEQDELAKVRREARILRDRTKAAEARADELGRALFTALVAATGRVENPTEIAYEAGLLADPDAIHAAIDAEIERRPYIRSRKIAGDVGQGRNANPTGPQDFSGLFN